MLAYIKGKENQRDTPYHGEDKLQCHGHQVYGNLK